MVRLPSPASTPSWVIVSFHLVTTSNLFIEPFQEPSPRDDVISLAYSLIYIITDSLPWMWELWCLKATGCSECVQIQSIGDIRRNDADLLRGEVHEEFIRLLEHATCLKFRDTPDYTYFIDIF